jgi:hypothetical protein
MMAVDEDYTSATRELQIWDAVVKGAYNLIMISNFFLESCGSQLDCKLCGQEFCLIKFRCNGLNCVSPSNSYVEFLTPVPQNVALIQERVFTEVIELKWGHQDET